MLFNVNLKEIYLLHINILSYLSIIGQNQQNSLKFGVFKEIFELFTIKYLFK